MTRTVYSRTEGMLYNHYRRKKKIISLRSRVIRIQHRIDNLRRDIKECNVDLGDTMKAIDYARDPIQNSSVTSNIERELERAIDKILKEIATNISDKWKTIHKINDMEKQIDNIELLLSELVDEELQILELKYGEKKSYKAMEELIPMGKSTIQRKHEDLMAYLIKEMQ